MATKKTSLRRKAEELFEKGRYAKVVPLLEQLEWAEPDHPRWPQKMGEALLKIGRKEDAISAYERAAQAFAEQGFLLKAIAVSKIIIGLEPDHQETQAALADLYSRQITEPGGVHAVPSQRNGPPPKRTITRGAPLETVNLRRAFPEEEKRQSLPDEIFEIPLEDSYAPEEEPYPSDEVLFPPEEEPDAPEEEPDAPEEEPDAPEEEPDAPEEESPTQKEETTQQLLTRLPPNPLFSSLNQHALRRLIEGLEVVEYSTGQRIIEQGDIGDALYVVVEGEAIVYREGQPRHQINRLGEGDIFGEIALLTNLARSATVQAVSPCTVLRISRDLITELIGMERHVLTVLLGFFRERLINTITTTSPIFAPLSNEQRVQFANVFSFQQIEAGFFLSVAGTHPDAIYAILAGAVEVWDGQGAAAELLWHLGSGDVCGLVSLLTGEPAAVSLRVARRTWVLRMDQATFRVVIKSNPALIAPVKELAKERRRLVATYRNEGITEDTIPILL